MYVSQDSEGTTKREPARARVGAEPRRGGSVLLVDDVGTDLARQVVAAARAARLSFERVELDDLGAALGDLRPIAVLFDVKRRSTSEAVRALRSRPALANVPLLGLTTTPDDVTFHEIFWWGMDDLVSGDVTRGLTSRLRALASKPATPAPSGGGTVVIEGRDAHFRGQIGRMFANSGHEVRFAFGAEDALVEARASDVTLVVSQAPDSPEAPLTVERARAAGVMTPWLIGARPTDAGALGRRIEGLGQVGLYDGYASPETVLFRANELRNVGLMDARRAPRVVYGTSVSFRVAGADADDVGFSYNVSESGLYLRTLAIVPNGTELWLELRPPRAERRIRVVGRVVWTRPFGPSHAAVVPPGMGVELTPGMSDDGLLRAGVSALRDATDQGLRRGMGCA